VICAAPGGILARRDRREGPGVALAEIELGRREPLESVPDTFWLHRRGAIAAWAWDAQRVHGRRWYRGHALARPEKKVDRAPRRRERSPGVPAVAGSGQA
jgi:hypothetical protein